MTWTDYIAVANLNEPIISWRSYYDAWLTDHNLPYFVAWTESYVLHAETIDDGEYEEQGCIDCLGILARNPNHPTPSQIVVFDHDTDRLELSNALDNICRANHPITRLILP